MPDPLMAQDAKVTELLSKDLMDLPGIERSSREIK
jgi:hypothetical protein